MGGMMIAIASSIYIQTKGIIGAFLFAIGLLTILNMDFKLYTGTIDFARAGDAKNLAIILIGNLIGTAILFGFPQTTAHEIVEIKLNTSFPALFLKSLICGIFVYTAVVCFKKGIHYMVPLCVAGFILFGAEHCIADFCYFIMSASFDSRMIPFFLITVCGNSLGAILIDKIKNF